MTGAAQLAGAAQLGAQVEPQPLLQLLLQHFCLQHLTLGALQHLTLGALQHLCLWQHDLPQPELQPLLQPEPQVAAGAAQEGAQAGPQAAGAAQLGAAAGPQAAGAAQLGAAAGPQAATGAAQDGAEPQLFPQLFPQLLPQPLLQRLLQHFTFGALQHLTLHGWQQVVGAGAQHPHCLASAAVFIIHRAKAAAVNVNHFIVASPQKKQLVPF